MTFNPDNALHGANHVVTAGNYAYVSCDRGVAVIDINDPTSPRIISMIPLQGAGRVAVQFRYAFVCDREGLKTVDITDPAQPVVKASVPIEDAKDVYLARTYAYVAAGKQGLAIVDMKNPEKPGKPAFFNADGALQDSHAVKVGMTNASLFAYVADGEHGLKVLQLTSPRTSADTWGFSPKPQPRLIATFKTKGPAVALSKGLDRDRAVDESGNQISVFGRRGARSLSAEEMKRLYMRDGKVYTVTDVPPGPAEGGK